MRRNTCRARGHVLLAPQRDSFKFALLDVVNTSETYVIRFVSDRLVPLPVLE